jgi:hypothetical protein
MGTNTAMEDIVKTNKQRYWTSDGFTSKLFHFPKENVICMLFKPFYA